MQAPAYGGNGGIAAVTTGNLVITLPTYAANDIVVITTMGWVPNTTTGTNTQSLSSPWTKYTPDVTTITSSLIDAEYAFWWARATSASSLGTTVTITRPTSWDTGTDTVWAGLAYRIEGCITTGNPFDQLTATAVLVGAAPTFPAITVSGPDRLVCVFMVKADNNAQPGATGTYTQPVSLTTSTGTDAGFALYTRTASSNVAATTPSLGQSPAQGGTVYFGVSFAPSVQKTAKSYAQSSSPGWYDDYNPGPPGNTTYSISSTTSEEGQSFTAGYSTTLSNMSFRVDKASATTGSVVARLYSYSGTFPSGTRGTLLATSNSVAVSALPTDGSWQRFAFSGADRVALTSGTNYWACLSYSASTTSVLLLANSTSPGDAPGNATGSYDIFFVVEGAQAVGAKKTGATLQRTATDTGTGTQSATRTFRRARTATGSGTGTQSATRTFKRVRTATGSGTGTQSATRLVKEFRTATGSGTGTQTALRVVKRSRTATGSGTGTQTASRVIKRSRTASGSGTGTQTATKKLLAKRTATGSGVGTAGNVTYYKRVRSATGSGGAGTGDLAIGLVKRLRTAIGSGTGTQAANRLVIRTRTAFGSGTSTQSATRVIKRSRTASGSGLGTQTAISTVFKARTATGSGFGTSTSTGVLRRERQATGFGISLQTAVSKLQAKRTALSSGLGTSNIFFVKSITRLGVASSGLGTSVAVWVKSFIFYPPASGVPWADFSGEGISNKLFSYAAPYARGNNIFKLNDNTYTDVDPRDPALYKKIYFGGHQNFLTAQEKADLVAAGYGGYIT